MTRVLIMFSSVRERRLAAARAVELAARGIDVDLAAGPCARAVQGEVYRSVHDVASTNLPGAASAPASREGLVRIIGAPPAVAPGAPGPVPSAAYEPWHVAVGIVAGCVAALVLAGFGLPLFYPLALGLFVAAGTARWVRARWYEPSLTGERTAPTAPEPSRGVLRIA